MSTTTYIDFGTVDVAVSRKVAYRPGDSVNVKSGQFVRYATIVELRQFQVERDGVRGTITVRALVRYTHGTGLVAIDRLNPAITL